MRRCGLKVLAMQNARCAPDECPRMVMLLVSMGSVGHGPSGWVGWPLAWLGT